MRKTMIYICCFLAAFLCACGGPSGNPVKGSNDVSLEIDTALIGRWETSGMINWCYIEFFDDGTFKSNADGFPDDGNFEIDDGYLILAPEYGEPSSANHFWYIIDDEGLHINYSTSSTPEDAEHSMYSFQRVQ